DTERRPVQGLEIGVEGFGGGKLTGADGKALLPVASTVKQGEWLSLAILHSPHGRDLVIVSPWDYRAEVPPFDNKPESFIRVVVIQRGDRTALESGATLRAR